MTYGRKYIEDRSMPIPFCGCWMWLMSSGSHGYGNAYSNKKANVAHRVSYEAFNGKITNGMLIQHTCDNRWCVNPDHLLQGTDASNANDKTKKGRAAKALTPDDIRSIREMFSAGTKIRAIARSKSVSQATIQQVLRRKTWKHIT